jgi:uncharacterized membrane protein
MIILLTYLIGFFPVIFFTAFTPYLTRKSESFGVSIPVELFRDPAIQRIRTVYRNCLLGSGLMISALILAFFISKRPEFSSGYIGLAMGLQLLLMFIFYLQGHRKMKELKSTHLWKNDQPQVVVIDTGFRHKRFLVSPWWFSLDFLIIGVTVILGFALYSQLPVKIPVHFNLLGQADRWMIKSSLSMLYAPAMQLLMTLLMLGVYGIIGKAKQQAEAAFPQKSLEQNRIFRYRWSAFIVFISVAMNLSFGLMLFTGFIGTDVVSIIFSGLMGSVMIWAVILCITGGQGGSRMKMDGGDTVEAMNRDEDSHWKLGIFYYNPDDPAVFVEKRFGIGWTVNFGRTMAWVCMGGLALLIIIITTIVRIFK